MITILFVILATLIMFDFIYSRQKKDFYKKSLRAQEIITRMAATRSKLIQMVYLGEIDPNNSLYFRYIYTISSYTIRALYKYGLRSQALENINILGSVLTICLVKGNIKRELDDLNYEQKRIFNTVTYDLITFYIDSNYALKFLFKITNKFINKQFNQLIKIFEVVLNKLKLPFARSFADNIEVVKLLNNYTNCYTTAWLLGLTSTVIH